MRSETFIKFRLSDFYLSVNWFSMQRKKWIQLVIMLLLALSLAVPRTDLRAQSRTVLTLSPRDPGLILGGFSTVDLFVHNAEQVNAFDIELVYDPNVLTLNSWAHGDFLGDPDQIHNISLENNPGSFRLAAVKLGFSWISGDGKLLTFTFQGTGSGVSDLTLADSTLANVDSTAVVPECEPGQIYVYSDPSTLPVYHLSGRLALQGQVKALEVPAALGRGSQHLLGPFQPAANGQPAGEIQFEVPPDTYCLTTLQPRGLNITAALNKCIAVTQDNLTFSPLTLRGGNAVWQDQTADGWALNNIIDEHDLRLVRRQYHQTGEHLDGDMNFSGLVDIFDLAITAGNMGLTSEQAYQDWLP